MPKPTQTLNFRLIYKDLPQADSALLVGLQTKKGEILATAEPQATEAVFAGRLQVKADPTDFSGPLVQGGAGGRFVYLSWKRREPDAAAPYLQRIKIPLDGIPAAILAEALAGGGLEADISGRKPHDTRPISWRLA